MNTKLEYAIIAAALLSIGVCFGSVAVTAAWLFWPKPACCGGNDRPLPGPDPKRRDALELHRWYRPIQKLGWNRETREWSPFGTHGLALPDAPLFVVARHGNVAELRGPVQGILLVPDGPSVQWFQPCDRGDVGELVAP